MTIKLISLARTPERLADFQLLNPHIKYEIFQAVDGSLLEKGSEILRSFFENDISYTNGAYGCALSHIYLWIECIEKNQCMTIIEDDAILHRNFIKYHARVKDQLPDNWDICLLTWNLDSYLVTQLTSPEIQELTLLHQNSLVNNYKSYVESEINPTIKKLLRAFGTAAYSISPAGAKKLIEKIVPISNFSVYFNGIDRYIKNNGIDIAMNNHYSELNAYVTSPPLAIPINNHLTSTVQEFNLEI